MQFLITGCSVYVAVECVLLLLTLTLEVRTPHTVIVETWEDIETKTEV